MNRPTIMTCRQLAAALAEFGDMPASVTMTSVEDDVLGVDRVWPIRVELTFTADGTKFVSVSGYEVDDTSQLADETGTAT